MQKLRFKRKTHDRLACKIDKRLEKMMDTQAQEREVAIII